MKDMDTGISMNNYVTNSHFTVSFAGDLIGFSGRFMRVSGLSIEFEYETYTEGGTNYPRQFLKNVIPQKLVLEQGTITSPDLLSVWIASINSGCMTTLNGVVVLKDNIGAVKRTWSVIDAFPTLYAGPSLDSMRPELAVTKIELKHNGCF